MSLLTTHPPKNIYQQRLLEVRASKVGHQTFEAQELACAWSTELSCHEDLN